MSGSELFLQSDLQATGSASEDHLLMHLHLVRGIENFARKVSSGRGSTVVVEPILMLTHFPFRKNNGLWNIGGI